MSFDFNNLDLGNVELSSGSVVIPVGDHVAKVVGAELTKSAKGVNQVKVTVENEDKQSLMKWITLMNPNSKENTRIGRSELKALLVHGGHPDPDNIGQHGIDSMVGLQVGIRVVEDSYNDKNGQPRVGSKLKSFIPPMNADATFNPPKGISETSSSSDANQTDGDKKSDLDDDIPF